MERLRSTFLDSLTAVVVVVLHVVEFIWAMLAYLGRPLWVALSFIGKFFDYLLQDSWEGFKDAARSG